MGKLMRIQKRKGTLRDQNLTRGVSIGVAVWDVSELEASNVEGLDGIDGGGRQRSCHEERRHDISHFLLVCVSAYADGAGDMTILQISTKCTGELTCDGEQWGAKKKASYQRHPCFNVSRYHMIGQRETSAVWWLRRERV